MPAPVRRDLEQLQERKFGDMKIVMGDPTGQIRCIVHKDVVKAESDATKGRVLTPEERPHHHVPRVHRAHAGGDRERSFCSASRQRRSRTLTKKHFETAEELAAAVSLSMGMSEEDIEAGLAARASQGTPGREEPRASQGTRNRKAAKPRKGSSRAKAPRRPRRGRRRRRRRRRPPRWDRANVVVDNGTDDEDSDDEDAGARRPQGPNPAGGGRWRLHDQVLGAGAGAERAGRGGEDAGEETEGRVPVAGGATGRRDRVR